MFRAAALRIISWLVLNLGYCCFLILHSFKLKKTIEFVIRDVVAVVHHFEDVVLVDLVQFVLPIFLRGRTAVIRWFFAYVYLHVLIIDNVFFKHIFSAYHVTLKFLHRRRTQINSFEKLNYIDLKSCSLNCFANTSTRVWIKKNLIYKSNHRPFARCHQVGI